MIVLIVTIFSSKNLVFVRDTTLTALFLMPFFSSSSSSCRCPTMNLLNIQQRNYASSVIGSVAKPRMAAHLQNGSASTSRLLKNITPDIKSTTKPTCKQVKQKWMDREGVSEGDI